MAQDATVARLRRFAKRSKDLADGKTQVRFGWNAIDAGQTVIDCLIPQLVVENSEADSRSVGKGLQSWLRRLKSVKYRELMPLNRMLIPFYAHAFNARWGLDGCKIAPPFESL
jgi:hypothetical protein